MLPCKPYAGGLCTRPDEIADGVGEGFDADGMAVLANETRGMCGREESASRFDVLQRP